ncbi:PQQ-dependent sugar dehydrogenase [Candidatus Daviesbacteria bacterium]|nr:PQQ-dependent sugar dehydrogenase [Candidatus Daviesbacteria bacterium]
MRGIFLLIAIGALLIIGVVFTFINQSKKINPSTSQQSINQTEQKPTTSQNNSPIIEVIATGLDTPWAIAFLPDKGMLVTERPGRVRLIDSRDKLQEQPVATLNQVKEIGEGGLMGIALHPDFSENNSIYIYYTYSGSGNDTLNRVSRFTYKDNRLSSEQIIVDKIPGATNHNGGRIKFGPDKFLYITTGDAQQPSLAQNKNSLAGKILRVTDEGRAAPGNPFNNLIYSYGHRNPQGIAWDSKNQLWETEHGPSGLETGNDEVNKIEAGKNYGWPEIRGVETKPGMEFPVADSGKSITWAPAGAAIIDRKLYFGGLRGQALYALSLEGDALFENFKNEFGRIREVILGPDRMLYITTSNNDGRGIPDNEDDRIIKIDPSSL